MAELKERGFNCVRVDSGAGLCHDADGRPRGPVALLKAFPGHGHLIRQMECCQGGRCDVLKRLIELFEAARRHDVQVILSSWFFLHTFWFLDKRLADELFAVPPEERFMYFAKALDWIIAALRERDLHKQIAFSEIFNEADGLPFITHYAQTACSEETLHKYRRLHEEGLGLSQEQASGLAFRLRHLHPVHQQGAFPAEPADLEPAQLLHVARLRRVRRQIARRRHRLERPRQLRLGPALPPSEDGSVRRGQELPRGTGPRPKKAGTDASGYTGTSTRRPCTLLRRCSPAI